LGGGRRRREDVVVVVERVESVVDAVTPRPRADLGRLLAKQLASQEGAGLATSGVINISQPPCGVTNLSPPHNVPHHLSTHLGVTYLAHNQLNRPR